MVAWWRPVAAFFLACLFIPTAVGTDPTQDDAGYGTDAPGQARLALPVELGTLEGQLKRGQDGADAYSFQVSQGDVLTVDSSLGAAASVQLTLWGPDPGGEDPTMPYVQVAKFWANTEIPVVAFTGGQWALSISYSPFDTGPLFSLTDYQITLSAAPDANAVGIESRSQATAVELALDQPTSGTLLIHLSSAATFFDPDVAAWALEFTGDLEESYGDFIASGTTQNGNAGTVHIDNGATPVPVTGPEPVEHPNLIIDEGLMWSTWIFRLQDATGTARISSFIEGNDHVFHVSLVPDAPVSAATWTDEDLVLIENGAEGSSLATPVHAEYGDYQVELDVDQRFFGIAQSDFGTQFDITSPAGETFTTYSFLQFVANLEPGSWTFDYPGYEQTGLGGHRQYALAGAFYPDLGLFGADGAQVPAF